MKANEIIKARRTDLGMTQKELAVKVGVTEATVSRWESGDIKNMRRDKIATLARVLVEPAQGRRVYVRIAEACQNTFQSNKKRAEHLPRPYEKCVHAVTFSSLLDNHCTATVKHMIAVPVLGALLCVFQYGKRALLRVRFRP